jgi:WhiB family redox-sensing transcriptional regulator
MDDGWWGQAACKGTTAEYFFTPPSFEVKAERDAREGAARRICGGCVVREACLDHALTTGEHRGIWGGLNELERRRLARRRRASA